MKKVDIIISLNNMSIDEIKEVIDIASVELYVKELSIKIKNADSINELKDVIKNALCEHSVKKLEMKEEVKTCPHEKAETCDCIDKFM